MMGEEIKFGIGIKGNKEWDVQRPVTALAMK